jgi:hypothetical protein
MTALQILQCTITPHVTRYFFFICSIHVHKSVFQVVAMNLGYKIGVILDKVSEKFRQLIVVLVRYEDFHVSIALHIHRKISTNTFIFLFFIDLRVKYFPLRHQFLDLLESSRPTLVLRMLPLIGLHLDLEAGAEHALQILRGVTLQQGAIFYNANTSAYVVRLFDMLG